MEKRKENVALCWHLAAIFSEFNILGVNLVHIVANYAVKSFIICLQRLKVVILRFRAVTLFLCFKIEISKPVSLVRFLKRGLSYKTFYPCKYGVVS
jgi:hypothetical protein